MGKIRIPAIRSKMGIWVYYVTALSFDEVNKYVRRINDELHKSTLLSGMIQRSITDNYKSIAHYLTTQEERFFNALILAVYDGQPTWNEIRIEEASGNDNVDMGLLTLSGDEKIFPVDGQHRVEGIKQALKDTPELGTEKVPVIFVGHSKDEEGMQRTRRMFSTLNRYAKPVSLRDIIALDEDDIVAIASREMIDNTRMFGGEKIFDAKTKALPENNDKAFTSIITYYECNRELLWLLIKDIPVTGLDGKTMKGKNKITEYIRHRPEDSIIKEFTKICNEYWNVLAAECKDYFKKDISLTGKYRNKEGGHLFFRPVSLYPFTKVMVKICEVQDKKFKEVMNEFPKDVLWLQHRIWRKIIWDSEQKKMIMGNKKLAELILLYAYDPELLTPRETEKMYLDWGSIFDFNDQELIKEKIDGILAGEKYI
ncbi:MAG: DGQHR domain-containing protein [Lachnospiraceae bacterium]|nr:DGQHR domain-containing protein [Lachnospiraceae bacterium]